MEQEMLENVEHALKNFNGRAIDCIAIGEMLIKYKKIKQELESVKEIYYTQSEVDTNYIPISVIQNKIDFYKKNFNMVGATSKINVLQELLEERNK